MGIFDGKIFFLSFKEDEQRKQALVDQIKHAGGRVSTDSDEATHILAAYTAPGGSIQVPPRGEVVARKGPMRLSRLVSLYGRFKDAEGVIHEGSKRIVKKPWVDQCLKLGKLVSEEQWELLGVPRDRDNTSLPEKAASPPSPSRPQPALPVVKRPAPCSPSHDRGQRGTNTSPPTTDPGPARPPPTPKSPAPTGSQDGLGKRKGVLDSPGTPGQEPMAKRRSVAAISLSSPAVARAQPEESRACREAHRREFFRDEHGMQRSFRWAGSPLLAQVLGEILDSETIAFRQEQFRSLVPWGGGILTSNEGANFLVVPLDPGDYSANRRLCEALDMYLGSASLVVSWRWIVQCFVEGRYVDFKDYFLQTFRFTRSEGDNETPPP